MNVNRIEALQKLENAVVAVTKNAILEQSNTFIFKGGKLITFNGEIYSSQKSPFGEEIEGSVMAWDLVKFLQRFPDEEIEVEVRGGELVIKGKRRSAGVKMMTEILLPYEDIPTPHKFTRVPENMRECMIQAARVCGKDETSPKTTHVHITSDRIESTDSFRVFRADIETGISKPCLVHALSLLCACSHKLKKISVSEEGWVHFVTEGGMLLGLLCSADSYYKKEMIDNLLQVSGEHVTLPSNLGDMLSRAEVMDTPSLSIGGWDSQVTITLKDNTLRVASRKEEGWFRELKKIKYEGPEMTFSIHPTFLKDLISRTRDVTISDRQIKVEVENIHFTAALESNEEGK